MSQFLVFSENYYKFKMRNIMTELCYERLFTTTNYDKVLMKQTKNQSTYSFAGQKLTVNSEIQCLLEAVCYLTFSSTRPSPVTVYPSQVKFELQLSIRPKFWVFKHIFLGSFHCGAKYTEYWRAHTLLGNSPIVRNLTTSPISRKLAI